jgi:hypothetical protein
MKRIDPPAGSRAPRISLEDIDQAVYDAIQEHRDRMLAVVHKAVEKYLNTRNLYYDDDSGFPNRSQMTGEYYISDESYMARDGGKWIQIGVFCPCLEKPSDLYPTGGDYLGLNVLLRCVPKRRTFRATSVDSSSM